MDRIIERALKGDPRSIARLITAVESENDRAKEIMQKIYPHTGKAHMIGVTGSPGAGKSTFLDKLISSLMVSGLTVGVIAVDPSSPFTGGAVLGDRLRMQQHSLDPGVFIRSMGTRGSLGGLSRGTYEAALILDACGKDIVLIETVGVGQSEIDIVKIADTVALLLVPGMGDDIQIMKAGIMEIADVFIVNKADRDGSERVVREVNIMLDLQTEKDWRPPVIPTVAESGEGVALAAGALSEHREFLASSDEGRRRKYRRLRLEVEEILKREIAKIAEEAWDSRIGGDVLEDLASRRKDPYTVADELLSKFISR
ncbi:MAG: methylmalonyl Co-A mutase-associated GTPase MeaB [Thermovirgaceae bacterium]|nr:methylmalonyl Co-A mutase-associated GTPase MeaB [Synergistales bacterium]MDI9391950.1 methylmalonyl Co-A mutase-associated GTPase MeaB [Synergistota bacterium]MDY0178428.1 methylmalonyl Co-A mutase-associated GTPase MeaB [Synergistaceae bacterium]HRW87455.1 methylmalonyl Co-A mutase-associated GTPase MeaB [Thermovirgaceae bacterium]MDD3133425.1 methylmalonyl Co-A mutase-associated GTPase MeaB [Synergistales bacterium]